MFPGTSSRIDCFRSVSAWICAASILFSQTSFACILILDGWTPMSVGERARLAEVVVVGQTRRAFRETRTADANTFTAEFRLQTVLKGKKLLHNVLSGSGNDTIPTIPRGKVVLFNVSNLGDRNSCYADVLDGEEYILFLTVFRNRLSAKYDDLFGAVAERTRENEDEIYESLGWKPWSDWGSCSETCGGGGRQTRHRYCAGATGDTLDLAEESSRCEGETLETRRCNAFQCLGARNLIRLMKLDAATSGVTPVNDRPAYTLDHKSSINFPVSKLIPRGLPDQYSLLTTFRLKSGYEGGYLITINDLLGMVYFAVKLGKTIDLEISREDGHLESFPLDSNTQAHRIPAEIISFDVDVTDGLWHQVALAVSASSVDLHFDCDLEIRRQLSRRRQNEVLWKNMILSIGKSFIDSSRYARFLGDVEQLILVPGSSPAKRQCGTGMIPEALELEVVVSNKQKTSKIKEASKKIQKDDGRLFNSKTKSTTVTPPVASLITAVWSEWSACSATCGIGLQARASFCPLANTSGISCHRRGTQTKICYASSCKVTKEGVIRPIRCRRPCQNGGTCLNSNDREDVCACPEGYYGRYCHMVLCYPKCRNGGSCTQPNQCSCQSGYAGRYCQTALCSERPCQNGGYCIRPGWCSCPFGFLPPECSTSSCSIPCYNGGSCTGFNLCKCQPGYAGNLCQSAVCEKECVNGGSCVAPNTCACAVGYTGRQCQTPTCIPSCLNGGSCFAPNVCLCPSGIYGANCDKFVCNPVCASGGTCIGLNTCACPPGHYGNYCQSSHCPYGCEHGSTCIGPNLCRCAAGYYGDKCEIKKCQEETVKEPQQMSFMKLFATTVPYRCGLFGWNTCNRTRYEYKTVYKTIHKTTTRCT